MIQKNLLKILFIEDLPSDVDLAVLELRREKIKFEHTTVCTEVDLIKALNEFKPDLIISDYMMPSFNGLQALKITKGFDPEIPFILYTGSVNEETAVECIKAGAQDYIIKEHMTRLPFAVKEALEQVQINKEKRASELLLIENEEKLQSVFRAAPVGIGLVVNRILIEVNDATCNMTGYARNELIGKSSEILYSSTEEFLNAGKEKYLQIEKNGTGTVETKLKCKDGKILNVIISSAPLDKNDQAKGVTFIVLDITERKRSEEALIASQHLFQTLAQVSPVGIFRTKPDGYTTYVNPKWMELSGLTYEEALGFGWLNAVHPDDRGQLEGKWKTDIQLQEPSIAEYRFLKSDGSIVWVIGDAVPEWNKDKITGYIGTITDITEHKKAEEAIIESETKYRHLVTQSPDGIFIVDLSGKFISVNKAICENLKYEEEVLLSMNLWDIVPEKYHTLHKQRLLEILNGESPSANAEYEVKGNDGISHSIEVMSSPYYLGNEIIGFQGIARDVTERKQAEKALRESEEKYRGIFENVQDVYYETLISGTILEVSPSIKILSKGQYEIEDLVGNSMIDFYAELKEREFILTELKTKGTITDFEVTFKNRDGAHVPCSISAKLVLDLNGNPKKIIGSMHDITDRKNATEALKLAKEKAEASDRLKTEFLNNISHEVRTPLNGILGFAEIAFLQELSEEEKNNSHAMLLESSERLLNTITNYMDISLITSGSMSVHNKDFFPVLFLRKIFNNYESVCSNSKLDLFLDIPGQSDDLSINSDPEIVQKILSHFLNNAVKFTKKGSIHFGFNRNEEQLEFFVKDSGIGIGLNSFNNIFDRFAKEDHGPHKVTEGSGLGLSIAKGMSEIIGGKIRVESELEIGSCFFLTIPIKKDAEISSSGSTREKARKAIPGSKILVAEDDETNFYFLNALLTMETDAKILHAANGREAIELFKANPGIKLILMDLKMPEMDGFEATRQIKLINTDVYIIAITAYAMSGDEARIMASGCDGYLSKPINKKSLLEKISEFVKI
jgi:PAS domain S-box-containing protein